MVPDRERISFLFGEDALADLDAYDFDVESDVVAAIERIRVRDAGFNRDGVLRQLSMVISEHLIESLSVAVPGDPAGPGRC